MYYVVTLPVSAIIVLYWTAGLWTAGLWTTTIWILASDHMIVSLHSI